ncbi:MAG TPA: DNA gyrase C-terminal beta-propeller domain-containing protein, partial [Chroococcidiopsis sp.]
RLLRIAVNDEQVPVLSRTSQGQQGMRLGKQETLIGCIAVSAGDRFVIVSAQGYAKQMAVSALRLANRGDLGSQSIPFTSKSDRLVGIEVAVVERPMTLLTSADRMARLSADTIPQLDKNATGDRLLTLDKGETITLLAIASLPPQDSAAASS